MIFKNGKTYDTLKFIANNVGPIIVCLTALFECIAAILKIWDVPYAALIIASLEAILAMFIKISKSKFNKMVEIANDACQGEEPDTNDLPEQK